MRRPQLASKRVVGEAARVRGPALAEFTGGGLDFLEAMERRHVYIRKAGLVDGGLRVGALCFRDTTSAAVPVHRLVLW